MDAVLYICHGSRIQEGCDQALEFVEKCKKQIDIPIQEASFLELANPAIEDAFQKCVEQGATRIVVIPVLLLTAGHAKEDIPAVLSSLHSQYPAVEIVYGQTFGVDEEIVNILLERVRETSVEVMDDAMVLLIGRGSSDFEAKKDFMQIASILLEKSSFKTVETCFLAAAVPTLEEGLLNARSLGHKQVFVMPYLLFTGVLMAEIQEAVKGLSSEKQQYIITSQLGYHDELARIVKERVASLLSNKGACKSVRNYAFLKG